MSITILAKAVRNPILDLTLVLVLVLAFVLVLVLVCRGSDRPDSSQHRDTRRGQSKI